MRAVPVRPRARPDGGRGRGSGSSIGIASGRPSALSIGCSAAADAMGRGRAVPGRTAPPLNRSTVNAPASSTSPAQRGTRHARATCISAAVRMRHGLACCSGFGCEGRVTRAGDCTWTPSRFGAVVASASPDAGGAHSTRPTQIEGRFETDRCVLVARCEDTNSAVSSCPARMSRGSPGPRQQETAMSVTRRLAVPAVAAVAAAILAAPAPARAQAASRCGRIRS
jgi:hypothetical protein